MNSTKTIIIIDNHYDVAEYIAKAIYDLTSEFKIIPSNKDAFKELYGGVLDYLIEPDNVDAVNSLKHLLGEKPDFIFIDFALLDDESDSQIDKYGGILRRTFIEKYYSDSHIIFISKFDKRFIEEYMTAKDYYIAKINHTDQSKEFYWKSNLKKLLQP